MPKPGHKPSKVQAATVAKLVPKPSKLRIVMAGHVVVPMPVGKSKGDTITTQALVLGVDHKPVLSLPLKYLDLDGAEAGTARWPRSECLYVDSNGLDYVMIDITDCALSIKPLGAGGGVTLGDVDHLVDLSLFYTTNGVNAHPKRSEIEYAPGVAARLELREGTLAEDAISDMNFVGWLDKTTNTNRFDKRLARFLCLESPLAPQHHIKISRGAVEYGLALASDKPEIVCRLTSLCGWTGSKGRVLDLDNGRTMFPGKKDRFPTDIIGYEAEIHPSSDPCNPARVSFS